MSALGLVLTAGLSVLPGQDRPTESDLFGGDSTADAGQPAGRPSEGDLFGGSDTPAPSSGGEADGGRDVSELSGAPSRSKFDTDEALSDPLKVGGSLLMTGQALFSEGRPTEDTPFSAPMLLETYMDARPNDRVRAFVLGRVQYDPTRPAGDSTTQTAAASVPAIGITGAQRSNPTVQLDQLWLRFDLLRKVYFTVGRQKVRWGVSRIWYPTDFLNSQPRDALNPFDLRLGVNMVKMHVPVEKLGWNFYGYGILDNIEIGKTGLSINRLGGAVRGEFVFGPAELGIGGVWMKGRRPRYAVDLSSAVGPIDVYAEAAFRDGRDFVEFDVPSDLTPENIFPNAIKIANSAHRPEGLVVQVSGGFSWQFNYTDKNFAVLAAEYFYNPVGYDSPPEYLINTFFPSLVGMTPDPIQRAPLYGGKHNLAIIASLPGLPEVPWITVSVSNIVRISDPSGLARIDAIFRVLTFLQVQVFAQFFYGQQGGELRFSLPNEVINQLIVTTPEDQRASARSQLEPLKYPPLAQVGVLLRLSL